jgi:hypothetical protein
MTVPVPHTRPVIDPATDPHAPVLPALTEPFSAGRAAARLTDQLATINSWVRVIVCVDKVQ